MNQEKGQQGGRKETRQAEKEDDLTDENLENVALRGDLHDEFEEPKMQTPSPRRLRHDGPRRAVNPGPHTLHGRTPGLFDPIFEASLVESPLQRPEELDDIIEAPAKDIGIVDVGRKNDPPRLQSRRWAPFDEKLVKRIGLTREPRRESPKGTLGVDHGINKRSLASNERPTPTHGKGGKGCP